jgi:hypothetical protein
MHTGGIYNHLLQRQSGDTAGQYLNTRSAWNLIKTFALASQQVSGNSRSHTDLFDNSPGLGKLCWWATFARKNWELWVCSLIFSQNLPEFWLPSHFHIVYVCLCNQTNLFPCKRGLKRQMILKLDAVKWQFGVSDEIGPSPIRRYRRKKKVISGTTPEKRLRSIRTVIRSLPPSCPCTACQKFWRLMRTREASS